MKTSLLIFLLSLLTGTAFTQISKGQFLVGGNINFESVKDENSIYGSNKNTNYFIAPNIGYFIIDKMASGLRINIGHYILKSRDHESQFNTTSVSPFLRYYFLPIPKKVNAFIDVTYLLTKTKWSDPNNEGYYEKSKGYNIFAGPSIFLTDKIALEFIFGFKHTKSDNFGTSKTNTFHSGFGFQIHLGKVKKKKSNP